jgi:hypothetical protein
LGAEPININKILASYTTDTKTIIIQPAQLPNQETLLVRLAKISVHSIEYAATIKRMFETLNADSFSSNRVKSTAGKIFASILVKSRNFRNK